MPADAGTALLHHRPAGCPLTFCTTCRGRTFHLRQSLPHNLAAEPSARFLVLDYNSSDGLEEWARTWDGWPSRRRLTYCRERTAGRFHMAHAKNLAARLAPWGVVCNLDADILLRPGAAAFLAAHVGPGRVVKAAPDFNTAGLLACTTEDFLSVRGYDEAMCHGWGHEDLDMTRRLISAGCELTVFPSDLVYDIPHGDDLRAAANGLASIHESNAAHVRIAEGRVAHRPVNPDGFGRGRVTVDFAWEAVF